MDSMLSHAGNPNAEPATTDSKGSANAHYPKCSVCKLPVAIGVQCSLCHQWYHNTPPPVPDDLVPHFQGGMPETPSRSNRWDMELTLAGSFVDSFRRAQGNRTPRTGQAACVALPYLMPFFCHECSRYATDALDVIQNDSAMEASLDGAPLFNIDAYEEDPYSALGPSNATQLSQKQVLLQGLREVAEAPNVLRAQRAEVQRRWTALFTPSVLRRLRAHLAIGNPRYRDSKPLFNPAGGRATEQSTTMPNLELVENPTLKALQGTLEVEDRGKMQATVASHIEALQKHSDAELRLMRRAWVGAPLDYANVGVRRSARENDASATMAASRQGRDVRLSHVAVTLEDSDDDTALSATGAFPNSTTRTPF
jgi:hypothetical protein